MSVDLMLPDPGALPAGRFTTVVADPPWRFNNTASRGAAENHYPTMSMDEIHAMPVAGHVAERSHCYLWIPNTLLRDGFSVLAAWGFEYKTVITWIKPRIGLGNYFRNRSEAVLFGTRGGLRTQDRALSNVFEAPRMRHSAKPPQFLDLVMKASPGPYLELFSRCLGLEGCQCSRCRLGWTTWGNQADPEMAT